MLLESIFDDPQMDPEDKHNALRAKFDELTSQLLTFEQRRHAIVHAADKKGLVRYAKGPHVPPGKWARIGLGQRGGPWVHKNYDDYDKLWAMTMFAKKLHKRVERLRKSLYTDEDL